MGLTPLTCVISHACTATVASMLEAKCDPNPELHGVGYGPLHAAVGFCRENRHAGEIARLLLKHGAELNLQARPRNAFNVISWGARAYFSVVSFQRSSLMSIKVFASLPGLTPLAFAALLGNVALVQTLLDAGAELLANDRGDTPADLAGANLHEDLLPLLSVFSI